MIIIRNRVVLLLLVLLSFQTLAQTDSTSIQRDSIQKIDSIQEAILNNFNLKILESEKQRIADSTRKADLEEQLNSLKTTDNIQKEELLRQLKDIDEKEKQRIAERKARIELLRSTAKGYPVIGVLEDTLFLIGTRIGASTPKERAERITLKIAALYDNEKFNPDSLIVTKSDLTYDIMYDETIVMSISEMDALWYDKSMDQVALEFRNIISDSVVKAQKDNSFIKWLIRIGLVILVLVVARIIVWLIGKGYHRLLKFIHIKNSRFSF